MYGGVRNYYGVHGLYVHTYTPCGRMVEKLVCAFYTHLLAPPLGLSASGIHSHHTAGTQASLAQITSAPLHLPGSSMHRRAACRCGTQYIPIPSGACPQARIVVRLRFESWVDRKVFLSRPFLPTLIHPRLSKIFLSHFLRAHLSHDRILLF